MRILALDLGDVRTGVCVSDITGTLAGESRVLVCRDRRELARTVAAIAREEDAGLIVVGLPLNMDGTEGPRAEMSRSFGRILGEEIDLPVEYQDERGTSLSANRILSDAGKRRGRQRAKVDAVAAAIILQTYLDRKKNAEAFLNCSPEIPK